MSEGGGSDSGSDDNSITKAKDWEMISITSSSSTNGVSPDNFIFPPNLHEGLPIETSQGLGFGNSQLRANDFTENDENEVPRGRGVESPGYEGPESRSFSEVQELGVSENEGVHGSEVGDNFGLKNNEEEVAVNSKNNGEYLESYEVWGWGFRSAVRGFGDFEGWWKRQADYLGQPNTLWPIAMAAALVGVVVLGQRWRSEKWKNEQIRQQLCANKALRCEIEAFKHRLLSYGIHDEIGFRSFDADGHVGMPESSLLERNAIANHDGFMAHSSCENWSELKPEESASKEMGRGRIMGFSEAVESSHGDQGEESDRKQVKAIERARYFPEDTFSGYNLLLWERIEGLQKRLHLLSDKKTMNCNLNDEWGSTHEELQDALGSYITSLRQGLKCHWRGSFPEVREAEVAANIYQTDGPVDVYMDTTQMGNRQQKSDSFIETHEKEGFTQVSTVKNSTLEPIESKIKDLSLRIHALEDDGKSVKQAMDSLKRQQYSVKYLKQIVQSLRKSEERPKGQINLKMISPQRVVSIASLIKYFLSQLPVGVRGILPFVLFRSYKHVQRR